jgi:glycosyltransferase involved in cell wall biosynthesis
MSPRSTAGANLHPPRNEMKVAVVTPLSPTGEKGGAELLYQGLIDGLRQNGAQADQIRCVSDESSFTSIQRTYLAFYDLDVSAYDGVISTKAPSYLVRHPNHVCYLLHTMRSYYDMFDQEFNIPSSSHLGQRELLHTLDSGALAPPRTRKIFAIGEEVAERLKNWNRLEAEVLRPALPPDRFESGEYRYLLIPSRLHRWKRIDLAIKAMSHVNGKLGVKITGTGEDAARFRDLARGDSRIRFLGWVSRKRLLRLYANALAVIFTPLREDFGFVTTEAFASAKPVITCSDSGEPARLVRDGLTGYVCAPEPESLAQAIGRLAASPDRARSLGEHAKATADSITWAEVGGRLLMALEAGS